MLIAVLIVVAIAVGLAATLVLPRRVRISPPVGPIAQRLAELDGAEHDELEEG